MLPWEESFGLLNLSFLVCRMGPLSLPSGPTKLFLRGMDQTFFFFLIFFPFLAVLHTLWNPSSLTGD